MSRAGPSGSGPCTPEQAASLLRRATLASVSVALILIVSKAVAWWLSGSVALLASLLDSMMDGGASLVTLLAVRYSLMPADAEHRFGHGKAEALAGLGQAAFITLSGLFLLYEGVNRVINPAPVSATGIALAVMLLSVVLTVLLVRYQRHVVRQTGSTAIAGDALHYVSDLAMNLAIIGAIIAAHFGYLRVDAVVALLIGGYILYAAWQIGYQAAQLLLDRELDDALRQQISAVIAAQPGVLGFHDLRTRQSGRTRFIQVHVELDGAQRLDQAHGRIVEVGEAIRSAMPGAEVIIHADPVEATRVDPVP
ncbi:MAG: cation diffusion facilitator family transporter [Alcanivorax sp.]|nr:cation diffusion facilitator family transporter [Alcanivorax sp.]